MRIQLLLIHFLIVAAAAHKILVYNFKLGHSHSNYLDNIADLLVDAGHNVTNVKLKDGTVKSKVVRVVRRLLREVDFFAFSELNPIMPLLMSSGGGFMHSKQCETTLDSGEVEKLAKERFDVYIVELFDICGMMLAHLLKPRAVIMSSTTLLVGDHYDEFGVPTAMSYNPMEALFKRRFGDDYPTLKEISSNVAYVFTNSEPLIDFATPTLTRVVPIGGLGAKEPKQLDEYWSSVMTRRPRVVLISFGSVAQSCLLAPAVKQTILKVAAAFPSITFIWKYERTDAFALEEAAKIENLILTEWMPQNDLLNHPNLAVFITHGGMGSVQELALRGKPAILVPVFADQPRNAAMMEHNRLGKVLSKLELRNHEKIMSLLQELLDNQEYADNAKRMSQMLAKKPFSSKDTLLRYVDFAAEFGPSTALRPQSHDMSFIEYHNLDIVLAAFLLVLTAAYAAIKLICVVLRKIGARKVKDE